MTTIISITIRDPDQLPDELLVELGRFATDWAVVEQEVMLHASALASQDTDGYPTDYLRMDFKRLREKWYGLAKSKLGDEWQGRLMQLNDRLARRSKARGYALHGIWTVTGPETYLVHWWEQKGRLDRFTLPTNLDEVRGQTALLRELRLDLVAFVRGVHR
jgi:hypothetical protein